MRRLAVICCALAICSCGTVRFIPSEKVVETVTVTETVHDTTLWVLPDSTILTALVECNERGEAQLREIDQLRNSSRAQTSLSMDSNKLAVKTVIDSMAIYLSYKERMRSEARTETVTILETVEVNKLRWHQQTLMYIGAAALAALLLYGIIKTIKWRSGTVRTLLNNK